MNEPEKILIEEMEKLLDRTSPNEVDLAALYVTDPKGFRASTPGEVPFGIPGAGVAMLVGPILLPFLAQIATNMLQAAEKKGSEALVAIASDYLNRKFKRLPRPAAKSKDEVIAAVCSALTHAGWETSKAGAAADLVWQYGLETGRRMINTNCGTENPE